MSKSVRTDTKDDPANGSGIGSQCSPHDDTLASGDACFQWGGAHPGWNVISNDCKPGYKTDAPHDDGCWVGEYRRTQCILNSGSGSGS